MIRVNLCLSFYIVVGIVAVATLFCLKIPGTELVQPDHQPRGRAQLLGCQHGRWPETPPQEQAVGLG